MMSVDSIVCAFRDLGSGWWQAAAAAAVAGAVLSPGDRLGAGVLAGGAVLAIALYKKHDDGHCCAECAQKESAAGAAELVGGKAPAPDFGGLGASSATSGSPQPASAPEAATSPCQGGCL
jgi:hypothetical protein